MKTEIEKFDGHINWLNKLAPYKLEYKCTDDCKMSGCPSHIATFTIFHATDTFHIDFGDGSEIYLDGVKFAMLLDFTKRFEII
jgi:hypothetical protein